MMLAKKNQRTLSQFEQQKTNHIIKKQSNLNLNAHKFVSEGLKHTNTLYF